MPLYYDDSFGPYEGMDDPEVRAFYFRNQRRSVLKECVDCGKMVRILPEYDCCNSCADKREQGLEI